MKKIPFELFAMSLADLLAETNAKIEKQFLSRIKSARSEYGLDTASLIAANSLRIRRAVIKLEGNISCEKKKGDKRPISEIYFSRSCFGAKNKASVEFVFE